MAKLKVVVCGGGFAGLETAFLLNHRLHDKVDITLISDQKDFLFRPNTIYIPFGADVESLKIPLTIPTTKQGIHLEQGEVTHVDKDKKEVTLKAGKKIPFDRCVIATGAGMRPSEIPGLAEHADTIWTPEAMAKLGTSLKQIIEKAKAKQKTKVLFLVPPNNKCSGPLYEMVFMVETHLRRNDVRDYVDLTWASFESSYIMAFGPRLHEVVETEFKERDVTGYLEHRVKEVTPNEVLFENGVTLAFDHLISFPPYIAKVVYPGLPADDRGFLFTEFESRKLQGHDDIYAPGDAGDFPIKQAFLAFLQADATAESIASEVLGSKPRAKFDPISMCVMEQFDKATFAQVPLTVTGDPNRPVEVRKGAEDQYKVGVSPIWRLGKKVLGIYLPMRFRAGEPFHAGTAWQMMDIGLHGMSSIFAD